MFWQKFWSNFLLNNSKPKNCFAFEKGFIGAIGDDLPSLIPIMVALLLFFSVFAAAITTYNQKNIELKKQLTLISISKQLKQDSLLTSAGHFLNNCENAKKVPLPYNFVAGVFPTNVDLAKIAKYVDEDGFHSFNYEGVLRGSSNDANSPDYRELRYYCKFIKIGSRDLTPQSKNYYMRFYPIAVQTKLENSSTYVVVPALMALVIWE